MKVETVVVVTIPHEARARIYAKGGVQYYTWVNGGVGWVVDDEPSDLFERMVWAARAVWFPTLTDITS